MKKSICFTFALIALGEADDFLNNLKKDWNLINYNDTIAQKGENISVGFIDSAFNLAHPSLIGKAGSTEGSNKLSDYEKDAYSLAHGTHVAGIAIGNNFSNERVHGIAPKAGIYGLSYLNSKYPYGGSKDDIVAFFKSSGVKIINNSWSNTYFPLINKEIADDKQVIEYAYKQLTSLVTAQYVLDKAKELKGLQATIELAKNGILQIYSSGNQGQLAPSINASMRTYDESLKAWISVGAFDSANVSKSGDNFIFNTQIYESKLQDYRGGFTSFANSFLGTQAYGILAPGYNIGSANAYYENQIAHNWPGTTYPCLDYQFCVSSGTSQAAPFVSGAAALVSEKFGFLDGGGIADVLLSTANSNVTLPDLIIKRSPAQWGTVSAPSDKHYYYSIIYTNEVDKSKVTDRAKVKADLVSKLKISESDAEEILSHLMYNDNGNFAIYMSKDELIGQGILDIQKALKGLAKLDANRLINTDVKTAPSGGNQAFYTINTKGLDGTFENNIEQVEWKPEWHLTSTSNLKDLDVGLIKTGAGTLTLSGTNNTYKGDTIADGGILKLSGTLVNSSAFARNGGTFNLASSGNVVNNVTALNNGIVLLSGGNIGNTLTSQNGGIIKVEKGANVTITNGVTNNGTLLGQGTINGSLTNNGLIKAGFFNADTDTANDLGMLTLSGKYTQGNTGILQLAFSKLENSSNSKNSNFKATTYDIKGGSLQYVPLQVSSSLIKANDEITIKLDDDLKGELDKLSISALPTKLLTFKVDENDKTKLFAVNKPVNDKDSGGGGDIMRALQGVQSNTNISASSANALASLENLPQVQYNDALKSIKDTPNNAVVKSIDNIRKTTTLKNTLFLINPFSSLGSLNTQSVVFAPTAAFGDEYFGKADDVFIKTEYSGGFTFSKTSHDDYDQKTYLIDLQAKKAINDNTELGAFLGLGKSKTEKSNSEIDSNIFSLGLSAKHDLGEFGVLGSASFGMSFNDYEQNIAYVPDSKSTADYKNYFLGLQAGVYKHFALSQSTQITPLALLEYTYIHQNAFKQKGALAKNFDAKNTNFLRTYLGANLAHKTTLGKYEISADAFAFYWHKFNNNKINQNLNFTEAKANAFKNTQKSEKNGFYGGVSLQARRNNIFAKITLSDEKTSAYNEFEVMLRLGLAF